MIDHRPDRPLFLAIKIAVLDFVMRVTPGLRGVRLERQRLVGRIAALEDETRERHREVLELHRERDRLLQSLARLIERVRAPSER